MLKGKPRERLTMGRNSSVYCFIHFACSLYVVCSVYNVYLATTALVYIYYFPIFYICLYCNIKFVCSLYIWPLALLHIFTTFLYFMVSCPTIRCQYWRLTNNKYTFQYNRDKCHRGTHSGKIFSQYLSSQHFMMNIQNS